MRTCVHPNGKFVWGIHRPTFSVINLRQEDVILSLGHGPDGTTIYNNKNFPSGPIDVQNAECVYEIPNTFPFWGTTYVLKNRADLNAQKNSSIKISLGSHYSNTYGDWNAIKHLVSNYKTNSKTYGLKSLPREILLTTALCSDDEDLLCEIAKISCELEFEADSNIPAGIRHIIKDKGPVPQIYDHDLYETVANNPYLPDSYKQVMVLNPGVQGNSPIVSEYTNETHVFEYMRANSYIPWGHYASNMAHDTIRYHINDLSIKDIHGLRHIYYQRIYMQLASMLGIEVQSAPLPDQDALEHLRLRVLETIVSYASNNRTIPFNATLWGWNYGFGFAPSGFRLHASHQQIHQQFALIPKTVQDAITEDQDEMLSYAIGDQVTEACKTFKKEHGRGLFECLISALKSNIRTNATDNNPKASNSSLIVYQDENVAIYIPKAQRFQSEVHIMCLKPVGNIIEADSSVRHSLDKALLMALKGLAGMGARMVTCCEASKRFDNLDHDQRLFYYLLPKHPISPGTFSEWQLRWISGHYPEDFAATLRSHIPETS